ncbi:hypothetical protein CPT_Sycamore_038 [Streptomyces phage Sycamore]|uniref:Uncharacterized protein n=1 Tax=Streptomyces phage Sycamore TaxID=2767589 RepID=A0A873WHH7_9CAUD|nr:hypothetical protein CPT_Sycamore_038 [Streptomyces phage Sycamore]
MTDAVAYNDAHDDTDAIHVRRDEDNELELTIAYGDGSSVRTVFLTGETLDAFAKHVAEVAEEVSPTEETEPEAPAEQSASEFIAERADAWHAARALLMANGGALSFDTTPEDVLELAKFLAGDHL